MENMYDTPDDETNEFKLNGSNDMDYGTNQLISQIMDGVMNQKSQFNVNTDSVIQAKKGIC